MCGVKKCFVGVFNLRERYRKKGQERMKSIGGRYLDRVSRAKGSRFTYSPTFSSGFCNPPIHFINVIRYIQLT